MTLFDVVSGQLLLEIQGTTGSSIPRQMAFSSDESFFLYTTAEEKETIFLYSLLPPRSKAEFLNSVNLRMARVSPSGQYLVTIDASNTLSVWSLISFKLLYERR